MKKIYLTLIFLMLLGGIFSVQYFSDKEKAKAQYIEPLVLRPDLIKLVDIGLHNVAADLMWLGAIQYFGSGESENYAKLPDYLNFTAEIDPKFSYPYAFGALVLPSIDYIDQGLELAQKGIDNGVQDWRIPYYTATTYFINKKDDLNAAKYFDLAANTPGVPDGIQKVAARFGNRPDRIDQTKQIWLGIYETTKDEVVKARAEKYIIHLEIVQFLNKAKEEYFKLYNKYPTTVNDLVTGKILSAIPKDPFDLEFEFDDKGNLLSK